jgi:hypothetical protein
MRDDNMEPRDNQQIADDNQQSGVADEQINNRGVEEGLDEEDADEDDEFGEDEDADEDDATS